MTRAFIELANEHGIYESVEPSHPSMLLQVADVGVKRHLKKQYAHEYTSSMRAANIGADGLMIWNFSERQGSI